MNYDYDIREYFDYDCSINDLLDTISDYDLLRLSTELLRASADRLDSDLDNYEINKEYINLKHIIAQLESVIRHYV